MARIYATVDDLPAHLRTAPEAEDLIRRASNLVTNAIASSVFRTDAYGMPVGDDLEACRDAVVIHVSTWLSTGVNPISGYAGKGKTITSKGSNGTTVAYAADAAADAYLNRLAEGVTLTPSARVPLEAQGLLGVVLVQGGSAGHLYARDYQPRRYDLSAGVVTFSRAEGVVRLDFNTRETPVLVEAVPDYLWPKGAIEQETGGVLVTFDAGTLTIVGTIDGDYAEGLLLWEASRG